MKRVTFKILFIAKQSRTLKDGKIPVLLRITVNGQRIETSINLKVDPEKWNAVAGKSIGNSREDEELNFRLDTIRLRLMQIYREQELDRKEISVQSIIDEYLGRNIKPAIMLLDVFREHNERCQKLVGKDMAPATVTRYETSLKHTANFIKFNFGVKDIPIEKVDHKFIKDYEFYLKTERNCAHNSATKYLKNFKKIIRIALVNDYIQKDPFAEIKFSLNPVERDFLESHEIDKVIRKELDIERLAQVRDIFIFCSFTGLAFSDVKQLTPDHISIDVNGARWIRKPRQKTKNMCNIPLMEIPLQIIERYKDNPYCQKMGVILPVLSNQKMNSYLKELGDLCGIKKQITTHTARHTFATFTLANGVSIESVAKMLGHSDTKMTRHYARVLDQTILREMSAIKI